MTHAPVQPPAGQPVFVKAPSNGLATAALVLGIIGTVLSFIPLIGGFGAFIGGVGLALAIAGFLVARKRGVGQGKSIAGLVLGLASIIIFFVVTAATVAAVDGAVKDFNKQVKAQSDTSAVTDVSDAKELKDAQLGTVKKDQFGTITINVTLTNSSPKTSDYMGTVVFESPNGKTQYGDGALFVENLNPGQTKSSEVMMLDNLPKGANKVVARLTDFDRTESF
jgi:hypothetical protein